MATKHRSGEGGGISGSSDGPATDASNTPVIDPTANVIALSAASDIRQDDLRDAFEKLVAAKIERIDALADLRFEFVTTMRAAEFRRVDDMAALRAEHSEKLRVTEAMRLDAVRLVDREAGSRQSENYDRAVQALAATTNVNAENLRTSLNSTATAIAKQLADIVSGFETRLGSLERGIAETKGRSTRDDPMLESLAGKIERMAAAQEVGSGKSQGMNATWGILLGAVGLVAGLFAIIARFIP